MTKYTDINSYSTSLQFKDGIDVVVVCEGESDKKVLDRVINESKLKGRCTNLDVSIESIQGMVKDKGGLGNKDCVVACIDAIPGETETIYGLIDREFCEFDKKDLRDKFRKYSNGGKIYNTRGHSIENYFFEKGIFQRALLDVYSGRIEYSHMSEAVNYFEEAIRWSLCLSLYFYERSILARTKEGFFDKSCWIFDSSAGRLSPNFLEIKRKLSSRGVSQTICDRLEVYSNLKFGIISRKSATTIKWMTHGHVGYSGIFSAMGAIVYSLSGDAAKGTDIANGSNELKIQALTANWLKSMGGYSKVHPLLKKAVELSS